MKQGYTIATVIVVILLAGFLFYYFRVRNKKEKCPDGTDVPASGNCIKVDETGEEVDQPAIAADANGCTRPSSYITNYFPLAVGMKGDLVKKVQVELNTQFNAGLSTDGFFGCNTQAAIKKAFNVETVDAQLYKDKILTPSSMFAAAPYIQIPPIDSRGCDSTGKDSLGLPCTLLT